MDMAIETSLADQIISWIGLVCALAGVWLFPMGGLRWLRRISGRLQAPEEVVTARQTLTRDRDNDATARFPMALHDGLTLLNDRPDQVPHVLIAGPSGSGKTTIARALLAGRRGDVCILNPKNNPRDWAPLPYVTYDHDGRFGSVNATLEALRQDLIRRAGSEPPLTVVLDDTSAIAQSGETRNAYLAFLRAAARMGRSKRVRLVVIAHETTAAALGVPGEAAILDNFLRVQVRRRRATLLLDTGPRALDTRGVPRLARDGLRRLTPWEPVSVSIAPWSGGDTDTDTDTSIAVFPDRDAVEPNSDRDALILLALQDGWSFNRLYRALGGNRNAVSQRWRELHATRQALRDD